MNRKYMFFLLFLSKPVCSAHIDHFCPEKIQFSDDYGHHWQILASSFGSSNFEGAEIILQSVTNIAFRFAVNTGMIDAVFNIITGRIMQFTWTSK